MTGDEGWEHIVLTPTGAVECCIGAPMSFIHYPSYARRGRFIMVELMTFRHDVLYRLNNNSEKEAVPLMPSTACLRVYSSPEKVLCASLINKAVYRPR